MSSRRRWQTTFSLALLAALMPSVGISSSLVNKEAVPTVGAKETTTIRESGGKILVTAQAPIPSEVTNGDQARDLAKQSAISRGQDRLMSYLLKKRTRKKKTLAEAMIPSLDLQNQVKALVIHADVVKTEWPTDACAVTISVRKKDLAKILKEH